MSPTRTWANAPCAYVILREGAEPLKPAAVKRLVRERGVAAYKIPDLVEFVDAFPQTGIGKVSKKGLRSDAAPAPAVPDQH